MTELSIKRKRSPPALLTRFYNDNTQFELSIDEAGRGCLFGRVYIACVVLPKEPELFDGKDIKDSKKFSSKKKIKEVSDYIKQNALYWHIESVESGVIDEINILQAVMRGMHACIKNMIEKMKKDGKLNNQLETEYKRELMAIIDGNYFNPYRTFDEASETIKELPAVTIEQGDAKYMGIAAASILAKVARDEYIIDLCAQYPSLIEKYGLDTNVGYGTKKHLDGIKEHGITQWHRKSFGICKTSVCNDFTM